MKSKYLNNGGPITNSNLFERFVTNTLRFFLVFLFVIPYFILILKINTFGNVHWEEFYRVAFQSLLQSIATSSVTILFGLLGAMGVLAFSEFPAIQKTLDLFVSLPNFLPTLFVTVACLNAVQLFGTFPLGFWGVVGVHTVINCGIVSVFLAKLISQRAGGVIELATIEGAGSFKTLWNVVLSLQKEIKSLAYLVFVFAFTSFSVPLLVGLNSGETIEVLIYKTLLGRGDLGGALQLSFIQILILYAFSCFLNGTASVGTKSTYFLDKISSKSVAIILVGLTFVILASSFHEFFKGWQELKLHETLYGIFHNNILGSLIECLFVAVLTFIFSSSIVFLTPQKFVDHFLFAFAAPSTVVVALSFYVSFDVNALSSIVVLFIISMAFTLTVIPVLYRLRLRSVLAEIESQSENARILGATRFAIFKKITYPQLREDLIRLSGWAAFWAGGDFALASLISGQERTLAMTAQTLLGGYRYHVATFFTFSAVAVGAVFLLGVEVWIYVCRKKFSA